jgi:rhodanese-related sulfurtransferase
MKTLKVAILLASTLVAAAPFAHSADAPAAAKAPATADAAAHAAAHASKAHILSRAELDKLLAQPSRTLVIDVRRPDEVSSIGGLPVYLSIQAQDLEASTAWIPKDRTLVLVSNHAGRAGKAADLLASKGFKVAGAVGVQLYEKDGGTLTHVAKPAATAATGAQN